MKQDKHTKKENNFLPPENLEQLHGRLSIPYTRSREEVWEQIESRIKTTGVPVRNIKGHRWYQFAAAALIILLIGSTAFLRFYSIHIHTREQTRSVILPDGSVAYLNTQSELSYFPYWWPVSRSLKLNGEAYFQVKKGKKFIVRSKKASTTVLGTSFDIYARNETYKVTCLTGKVRVKSRKTDDQIILTPSSSAEVDNSGKIYFRAHIQPRKSIAWKKQFVFTHADLNRVIENLEKRYNVHIELITTKNYFYSGSIPANIHIEEALNLICKPFGLTFVRKSDQIFMILQE